MNFKLTRNSDSWPALRLGKRAREMSRLAMAEEHGPPLIPLVEGSEHDLEDA